MRKVYGETFDALRNNLREVQATTAEIQSMLHATFRQLNAEHGFTLQAPAEPDLPGFEQQLGQIEQSHIHYLGVGNLLKLAQPDFCDKLVRALASRLRVVNEAAMTEVERWSKGAGAQLDAQLKERRRNFTKRIEAVERIQSAAGNLDERLAELAAQEAALAELHERLRRAHRAADQQRSAERRRRRRAANSVPPEALRTGGAASCAPTFADAHRRLAAQPWPQRTALAEHARSLPCLAVRGHAPADPGVAPCWATSRASWSAFPTVQALAAGTEDEVLGLWSGLGYYSRARNMHRCAQEVVARFGGAFPRNAGRAADPAGHRPLHRRGDRGLLLRRAGGDPRRQRQAGADARAGLRRRSGAAAQERALWDAATELLPPARERRAMARYTQGLMDLGATVCMPRKPSCMICPVQDLCVARREARRSAIRSRRASCGAARSRSGCWKRAMRRAASGSISGRRAGIWAGLYCLPVLRQPRRAARGAVARRARGRLQRRSAAFLHVLTHKDLHLHPVDWTARDGALLSPRGAWFAEDAWPALGLPAPVRKLLAA